MTKTLKITQRPLPYIEAAEDSELFIFETVEDACNAITALSYALIHPVFGPMIKGFAVRFAHVTPEADDIFLEGWAVIIKNENLILCTDLCWKEIDPGPSTEGD